ncbi:hypothetical protein BD410DRAFT_841995 [Rickenella mellea]|uniref:Uncharacterized protein n=1 Tax=Rickenella mellea TaxID=50990 RepID=A0A4Y7PXN1_9AGAM|nr:hypothetical protein BD410DRAFT_841995 [Rickenella mellea]
MNAKKNRRSLGGKRKHGAAPRQAVSADSDSETGSDREYDGDSPEKAKKRTKRNGQDESGSESPEPFRERRPHVTSEAERAFRAMIVKRHMLRVQRGERGAPNPRRSTRLAPTHDDDAAGGGDLDRPSRDSEPTHDGDAAGGGDLDTATRDSEPRTTCDHTETDTASPRRSTRLALPQQDDAARGGDLDAATRDSESRTTCGHAETDTTAPRRSTRLVLPHEDDAAGGGNLNAAVRDSESRATRGQPINTTNAGTSELEGREGSTAWDSPDWGQAEDARQRQEARADFGGSFASADSAGKEQGPQCSRLGLGNEELTSAQRSAPLPTSAGCAGLPTGEEWDWFRNAFPQLSAGNLGPDWRNLLHAWLELERTENGLPDVAEVQQCKSLSCSLTLDFSVILWVLQSLLTSQVMSPEL